MSAVDVAFFASALLTLGGALVVVAARRTPITNAIGLVASMTGVAGACALAGAPLLGALVLISASSVAIVVVLFAVEWVGTGRDALVPLSAGRTALRALAATIAIGLTSVVISGLSVGVTAVDPPEGSGPGAEALGLRLFGAEPMVVVVCGLLLLVAVVAGATLAARRAS